MICTKCDTTKGASEFSRHKTHADKASGMCRQCVREYMRDYCGKNKDKKSKSNRKYYEKKMLKLGIIPPLIGARGSRVSREEAAERRKTKSRDYHRVNKGALKAKRQANTKRRVSGSVSSNIYSSLSRNKGGRKWESLVGYTLDELRLHLESLFTEGMSFDNHGEWHIDHIIPISAFNFATAECLDFKRCWALGNLQPLWAKDNLEKWAKLEEPFQPGLNIQCTP